MPPIFTWILKSAYEFYWEYGKQIEGQTNLNCNIFIPEFIARDKLFFPLGI